MEMMRKKFGDHYWKMKGKYDGADEETKKKIFIGVTATIAGLALIALASMKAAKMKRRHWEE